MLTVLEMGKSNPKVTFKQGKISGTGAAKSGSPFLSIVLAVALGPVFTAAL